MTMNTVVAEHEQRAEDRRHRLRAAQAVREPRRRPPHGQAHREQAHAEREDVHQEVERVGLKHHALGDDRAAELEHEEGDDDAR